MTTSDLTPEKIGAIVSAYTGFLVCDFSAMHEYAEKILGRPVWTHEFASREITRQLREKAFPDLLRVAAWSSGKDVDKISTRVGKKELEDPIPHDTATLRKMQKMDRFDRRIIWNEKDGKGNVTGRTIVVYWQEHMRYVGVSGPRDLKRGDRSKALRYRIAAGRAITAAAMHGGILANRGNDARMFEHNTRNPSPWSSKITSHWPDWLFVDAPKPSIGEGLQINVTTREEGHAAT